MIREAPGFTAKVVEAGEVGAPLLGEATLFPLGEAKVDELLLFPRTESLDFEDLTFFLSPLSLDFVFEDIRLEALNFFSKFGFSVFLPRAAEIMCSETLCFSLQTSKNRSNLET